MKKKTKKSARQKAILYADKWMSRYIRARDGRCVLCGKTQNLTNGHLITRGKYSVRWDECNCYCQCTGCNMRHEYQPEIFTDWWINKNGIKAYHKLVKDSNTIIKYTTPQIIEIGDMYKRKFEEIDFGLD